MLAYADREAVEKTLATGQAHFWSRSRQALWKKGETSGNTLQVVEVTADCDGDALLVRARPAGPTCHRGTRSCFEPNAARLELGWLAAVLESRRDADPETQLHRAAARPRHRADRPEGGGGGGRDRDRRGFRRPPGTRRGGERRQALIGEAADLLYHLLVLLQASGVDPGKSRKS